VKVYFKTYAGFGFCRGKKVFLPDSGKKPVKTAEKTGKNWQV